MPEAFAAGPPFFFHPSSFSLYFMDSIPNTITPPDAPTALANTITPPDAPTALANTITPPAPPLVIGGASVNLSAGLLAKYDLDDTQDSSGNGHHLTNNNGVTFVAGKVGNCASFDPTASQNLVGSDGLNLNGLTEASIVCWAKLGPSSTGTYQGLVGFDNGYGGSQQFGIEFNLNAGPETIYGYGHAGGAVLVADDTALDAAWKFIALRFSASQFQIRYNDGAWVSAGCGASLDALSGAQVLVGSAALLASFSSCLIDSVRIYSRALTDGEVDALYNSGAGL